MFGLGMTEILVICGIGFVLFGAKKLPDVGSSVGRAISNFRKAADGKDPVEPEAGKEVPALEAPGKETA
jgi:sec-independent protein translocase protein TatA